MGSYIDLAGDGETPSAYNAQYHWTGSERVRILSISPEAPRVGDAVTIRILRQNRFIDSPEYFLEAVCEGQIATVAFVPDGSTAEEDDYFCVLDTTGWPEEAVVNLTVYCSGDLAAFQTASLELDSCTAIPAGLWTLF